MNLDDSKRMIKEISELLDNKAIMKEVEHINRRLKERESNHNNSKEVLNDALNLLLRKNRQLDAELQQLQIVQSRNNEQYNKKNTERLRLAKKMIELEQKNEEVEEQIADLELKTTQKEDEIHKIGLPSSDQLFYEIVRGFGVEFSSRNGKLFAKVRNKQKNDLYSIEVSDVCTKEMCDSIWDLME